MRETFALLQFFEQPLAKARTDWIRSSAGT
jgi:hypothetical protein